MSASAIGKILTHSGNTMPAALRSPRGGRGAASYSPSGWAGWESNTSSERAREWRSRRRQKRCVVAQIRNFSSTSSQSPGNSHSTPLKVLNHSSLHSTPVANQLLLKVRPAYDAMRKADAIHHTTLYDVAEAVLDMEKFCSPIEGVDEAVQQ